VKKVTARFFSDEISYLAEGTHMIKSMETTIDQRRWQLRFDVRLANIK
jgi:hypothetical protein